MQCPRCGGSLPQEGGPCPNCGVVVEQQVQQAVTGTADGPSQIAFPDVCKTPAPPAPEVPIPYPNIDHSAIDGPKAVKTDGKAVMAKGDEYAPTEGDEPGTGGPVRGSLPGGAPLVAGVVIVLVVVVATIILLSGDRDGDGGPGGDLFIDPEGTSAMEVWEPTPGFHLAVMIRNNATEARSLDGHDLLVTVLVGTDEVGRTTMALSGDLAPETGRGLLIDVGADLTSGQRYTVNVLLRKGSTTVDAYHTEVTLQQY